MKRIVRRVQSLNERAAELTAAVGQLPQRVAELRGAVTATSGELHHLKSEIQGNVADLMVDREEDLSTALAEIAGHAPLLAEAGFVLDGFDIEVSPIQQLVIELVRHEDVEIEVIQARIASLQPHGTIAALLSAILKARAVAETVDVNGLDYHKLEVTLGPVPSIRLCWRSPSGASEPATQAWQPSTAMATSTAESSFFGPSATAYQAPVASIPYTGHTALKIGESPTIETSAQGHPALAEFSNEPVLESHQGAAATPLPAPVLPPLLPDSDPLARFKVMPTLGRKS